MPILAVMFHKPTCALAGALLYNHRFVLITGQFLRDLGPQFPPLYSSESDEKNLDWINLGLPSKPTVLYSSG